MTTRGNFSSHPRVSGLAFQVSVRVVFGLGKGLECSESCSDGV